MADNVLKKYEIQITANTDELEKNLAKAEQAIQDFSSKKGLDKSLLGQFVSVQESISAVSKEITSLRGAVTSNANSLKDFSTEARQSYAILADAVDGSISKITERMASLETTTNNLFNANITESLDKQFTALSENIDKVLNQYQQFGQVFKDFSDGKINSDTMGGLIASFNQNQTDIANAQQNAIDMMKVQKEALEDTADELEIAFKGLFEGRYSGLSELLNDSDFSVKDFDTEELKNFSVQLQNFVTDVKKNLNALNATGGLSAFFTGEFLGNVNDKTLDAFQQKLTKQINGYIQNPTGVSKKSAKIDVKVELADSGDVANLKQQLKEEIIRPLKEEAARNKVEIPVTYKLVDESGAPISSSDALNNIKLNLQADTDAITESVRVAIEAINNEMRSESAPKINLRAKIDKESLKGELSTGAEISLGSIKQDLSQLTGALNINTDGLAKEATLSSILTTLQTIGQKAFGDQWTASKRVSAPTAEDYRHYTDYRKMLGVSLPTTTLTAAGQARLDTVNDARWRYHMGYQQEYDMKQVWKAITHAENLDDALETLRGTKYYSYGVNTVGADGTLSKKAAYTSGGNSIPLSDWQSGLETYTETIFNKYREDMDQLRRYENDLLGERTIFVGKNKIESAKDQSQSWKTVRDKAFGKLLSLDNNYTNEINWKDIAIAELKAEQEQASKGGRKKFLESRQSMINDLMDSGRYKSRASAGDAIIAQYFTDQINGVKNAKGITSGYEEILQKAFKKMEKGLETSIQRMTFADDAKTTQEIKKELGISNLTESFYQRERRGKTAQNAAREVMYPGNAPAKKGEDASFTQNWGGALIETDKRKSGGVVGKFVARKHTALNANEAQRNILDILAPLQEETQPVIASMQREIEAIDAQLDIRKQMSDLAASGKRGSDEWNVLQESLVLDEEELRTKTDIEAVEKRIQKLQDKKVYRQKEFTEDDQNSLDTLQEQFKSAKSYRLFSTSESSNRLASRLGLTVGEVNDLANIYTKSLTEGTISREDKDLITGLNDKISKNRRDDFKIGGAPYKALLSIGISNGVDENNKATSKVTAELDELNKRLDKATTLGDKDVLSLKIGEKEEELRTLRTQKQTLLKSAIFSSDDDRFINYALGSSDFLENRKKDLYDGINAVVGVYKKKLSASIFGDGTPQNPGWILPYDDDESYAKDLRRWMELNSENLYYDAMGYYTNGYESMRKGGYSSRASGHMESALTPEEQARKRHNLKELKDIKQRTTLYEARKRLDDPNFSQTSVLFSTPEEREEFYNKKVKHDHPTANYESLRKLKQDHRITEWSDLSNDIFQYDLLSQKDGATFTDEEKKFFNEFTNKYKTSDDDLGKSVQAVLANATESLTKIKDSLEQELQAAAEQATIDDANYYKKAAEKGRRQINKNLKESAIYGTGPYGALGKDSKQYKEDIRGVKNTEAIYNRITGKSNDMNVVARAVDQRNAAQAEIDRVINEIMAVSGNKELLETLGKIRETKKNLKTATEASDKNEDAMDGLLALVPNTKLLEFADKNRKYINASGGDVVFTWDALNKDFAKTYSELANGKMSADEIYKVFESMAKSAKDKYDAENALANLQKRMAELRKDNKLNISDELINRYLTATEQKDDADATLLNIRSNPNLQKVDKAQKLEQSAKRIPQLQQDVNDLLSSLPSDLGTALKETVDEIAIQRGKKAQYAKSINGTQAYGYIEASKAEKSARDKQRRLVKKLSSRDAQTFSTLNSQYMKAQADTGLRTLLDTDYSGVNQMQAIDDATAETKQLLNSLWDNSELSVESLNKQLKEASDKLNAVKESGLPKKNFKKLQNKQESLIAEAEAKETQYLTSVETLQARMNTLDSLNTDITFGHEGTDEYNNLLKIREDIIDEMNHILNELDTDGNTQLMETVKTIRKNLTTISSPKSNVVKENDVSKFIAEQKRIQRTTFEGNGMDYRSARTKAHYQNFRNQLAPFQEVKTYTTPYFEEDEENQKQKEAERKREAELKKQAERQSESTDEKKELRNRIEIEKKIHKNALNAVYYTNREKEIRNSLSEIKDKKQEIRNNPNYSPMAKIQDTPIGKSYLEDIADYKSIFEDTTWMNGVEYADEELRNVITNLIDSMSHGAMPENGAVLDSDTERLLLSLITRVKNDVYTRDSSFLDNYKIGLEPLKKALLGKDYSKKKNSGDLSLNEYYEVKKKSYKERADSAQKDISFDNIRVQKNEELSAEMAKLDNAASELSKELTQTIFEKVKASIKAVQEKLPGNNALKSGKFYDDLVREIDAIVLNNGFSNDKGIAAIADSTKKEVRNREALGYNPSVVDDYTVWERKFNTITKGKIRSSKIQTDPAYVGKKQKDILREYRKAEAESQLDEEKATTRIAKSYIEEFKYRRDNTYNTSILKNREKNLTDKILDKATSDNDRTIYQKDIDVIHQEIDNLEKARDEYFEKMRIEFLNESSDFRKAFAEPTKGKSQQEIEDIFKDLANGTRNDAVDSFMKQHEEKAGYLERYLENDYIKYDTNSNQKENLAKVQSAKENTARLRSEGEAVSDAIKNVFNKLISQSNAPNNQNGYFKGRYTQDEFDAKTNYNKALKALKSGQLNGAVAEVIDQLQEAVNRARVEVDALGTLAYDKNGYARLSAEESLKRNNLPIHDFINSTIKDDDYKSKSYSSTDTPWVEGLATEDTLRQIYNAITEGNRILGSGEDRVITHEGDDRRGHRRTNDSFDSGITNNSYHKNKKEWKLPDNTVYIDNQYDKKIPHFYNSKSPKPTTEQEAIALINSLSDDDLAHLVSSGSTKELGKQQSTLGKYLSFLRNSTNKVKGMPSKKQLDEIAKKAGLTLKTNKKTGEEYYAVTEYRANSKWKSNNPQPNNGGNNNPPNPNNNSNGNKPNPKSNTDKNKPNPKSNTDKNKPNPSSNDTLPNDVWGINDFAKKDVEDFIKEQKAKGAEWVQTGYEENKQDDYGRLDRKTIQLKHHNADTDEDEYLMLRYGAKESSTDNKNRVPVKLGGTQKVPSSFKKIQKDLYDELDIKAKAYRDAFESMAAGNTPVNQADLNRLFLDYSTSSVRVNNGFGDKAKNRELDKIVDDLSDQKAIKSSYQSVAREMYGNKSILMRQAKGTELSTDTTQAFNEINAKMQEADKRLDNLVQMGVVSQEVADTLREYKNQLIATIEQKANNTKIAKDKAAIRDISKKDAWRDTSKWNELTDEAKGEVLERDWTDALNENERRNQALRKNVLGKLLQRTGIKAKNPEEITAQDKFDLAELDGLDSYLRKIADISEAIDELNRLYEKQNSSVGLTTEELSTQQELISQIETEGSKIFKDDVFKEQNAKYGGLKRTKNSNGGDEYVVSDNIRGIIGDASNMNIASVFPQSLTQLLTDISKIDENQYTEYAQNQIQDIRTKYDNLAGQNLNLLNVDELDDAVKKLQALKLELESVSSTENKIVDSTTLSKMSSNFEQWLTKNSKVLVKYKDQVDEIRTALQDTAQSNYNADKLVGAIESLKSQAAQAGDLGQTFFDAVGSRFKNLAVYLSSFVQFYDIIRYFQQGISIVKEYDDAMTGLKKVAQGTIEQIDAFGKESFEIADSIGATSTAIIQAGTEWARLGKDMDSAKELAQASTIYANVGDIDATTATQDLISAMNAFSIADEQAMSVVDKMNEIGNNYAVSSAQLGEILEKSSASLAVSGDDIDHVIAMGAAMNSVLQDASTVGSTLKILGLRLRGTSTEIEEMGEETDGMAESTSKLRADILALTNVDGKGGFDIMKNNKEYKTTYDILKGISEVWDDMSQINQSALLEEIAGKNRAQGAAALIANFDTAEKALQDSLNAEGSAVKENNAYMESISAHQAQLSNAWSELWTNAIDKDVIIFFNDLGTEVLKLVNDLGPLKTMLIAISTAFLGIKPLFQGKSLLTPKYNSEGKAVLGFSLNEANDFVNLFNRIRDSKKETPIFTSDAAASNFLQQYINSQNNGQKRRDVMHKLSAALSSTQDGTKKDPKQMVTQDFVDFVTQLNGTNKKFDNINQALAAYQKNIQQTKIKLNEFSASTIAAKVSTAVLSTALTAAASIAVTALISGIVDIISYCTQYDKKLRESAKTTAAAYKESCDSLDEYADKIKQDHEIIKDNASSVEDVANARLDLINVQDELIDKFGDEQGALENITEAINGQSEAWDNLKESSWETQKSNFINENKAKGIWGYVKEGIASISSNHDFNKPDTNVLTDFKNQKFNYESIRKTIGKSYGYGEKYVKFNSEVESLLGDTNGLHNTTTDIYTIIDALTKAKDIAKETFSDDVSEDGLENITSVIDNQLAKYKSLLDEYGDFVEQYALNEKILSNDAMKEKYNDFETAYSEYTEAYAKGNTRETNEALESFSDNLNILKNSDQYKNDVTVKHYIDNLYTGVQLEANKHQFELKYEANTDDIKSNVSDALSSIKDGLNENAKILTKDYVLGLDKADENYQSLVSTAEQFNLTIDELLSKLEELAVLKTSAYQELVNGGFSEEELDKLTNDQISQIYGGTQSYKQFLSSKTSSGKSILDLIYGENSRFTDYQRDWMATSEDIAGYYDDSKASTTLGKIADAMDKAGKTAKVLRYRLSNTVSNVDDLTEASSALSTALSETRESGLISSDTLTDLNSKIEDTSDLLILSADGVKLNSDAMDSYIDTQAKDKTEELDDIYKGYIKKLSEEKNELQKLEDASQKMNSTNKDGATNLGKLSDGTQITTDNIESLTAAQNENIESTKKQLQTISLQMGALKELTSAYNKYITATNTKNQGDRFDTITSAYESTKKLFDNGQYYTDDVMQFTKLFGDPSKTGALDQNSSRADIQTAAEKAMANYKKYITDDDAGPIAAYKAMYSAIEKAGGSISGANFIKDDTGAVTGINFSDFDKAASAIGLTGDAFEVLMEKLQEYQGNDIFTYTGIDKSTQDIINDISAANQTISENTDKLKENSDAKSENEISTDELKDSISTEVNSAITSKKQEAIDKITASAAEETNEKLSQLIDVKISVGAEFSQEDYDIVLAKAIDLKKQMEQAGDEDEYNSLKASFNNLFEKYGSIFGDSAEATKNIILTADVSSFLQGTSTVEEKQDEIENWFDQTFNVKVNTTQARTALNDVEIKFTTLKDEIEKNPIELKVNTTTTEDDGNNSGESETKEHRQGGHSVNGGIALANGTINAQIPGNTLVGELGQELVVDRSTGKWRTVGDNGAEFTNIDKGDIVFNANQTKALLSSGHINGRGKALADGQNNHLSGKAMLFGSGVARQLDLSGHKTTNQKAKATEANTKATEANTKATEDETKQTYNWIETLTNNIDHFRDMVSETQTNEWQSYTTRISGYRSMIEYDNQAYQTWTTATVKYGEEFNEKLDKVREAFGDDVATAEQYVQLITHGSLGEDWKTELIQQKSQSSSGSSSSSSSDDPLVKAYNKQVDAISEAMTWHENLQTATSNQIKYLKQQHEDLKQIYDLQLEQNNTLIDAIESGLSELQTNIDMKSTVGEIVTAGDYEDMISATDDKISKYYERIEILQNELAELGDDTDSAEYQEIAASIAECNAQILDCEKSQAEWNETIKQLPIEHIESYIENIKTAQSDLNNYIAELDAAGKKVTTDLIKQQMEVEQLLAKQYTSEIEKVYKNLNTYDVGSDKWNEAYQKMQSLDDEISSIVQNMIGFNKQLLAMPVDTLSDVSDQLSSISEGLTAVQDDNLTVINAAIDTITRNAEELTKPLQEQVDLLERESAVRQDILDQETAAYNLAKAMSQKSVSVIQNGKITYTTDADSVRQAQNDLDTAKDTAKKNELQRQIDKINDDADDLKEKWELIQTDSQYKLDVDAAAKLAGMSVEEFKQRVLTNDDDELYHKTKNSYEDTAAQQSSVEQMSNTLSTIQTLIEEINTKYLAGQLTADQAKQMVQQLINAGKDGLSGQENLDNRLNIEQKESTDSAIQDAKDSIAKTSEEYNSIVQQTVDNTAIIAEYQKKENELTEEIKNQLEKANEAYQNTLEAESSSGSSGSRTSNRTSSSSSSSSGSSSSGGVSGGILFSSDAERESYNSRWGTSHTSSDSSVSSSTSPTSGYVDSSYDKEKNTSGNGKSHVKASGYKFADGIENGVITGVGRTNSDSEKFRLLQQLAVDGFKSSEVPILADLGEAVLNPTQQANVFNAMNQSVANGMVAGATMRSVSPVVNISLGDMSLPNVTNGSEFAKTLTQTIEPTMNQYFSKFFK